MVWQPPATLTLPIAEPAGHAVRRIGRVRVLNWSVLLRNDLCRSELHQDLNYDVVEEIVVSAGKTDLVGRVFPLLEDRRGLR